VSRRTDGARQPCHGVLDVFADGRAADRGGVDDATAVKERRPVWRTPAFERDGNPAAAFDAFDQGFDAGAIRQRARVGDQEIAVARPREHPAQGIGIRRFGNRNGAVRCEFRREPLRASTAISSAASASRSSGGGMRRA